MADNNFENPTNGAEVQAAVTAALEQEKKKKKKKKLIIIAVVAVLIIFALAVSGSGGSDTEDGANSNTASQQENGKSPVKAEEKENSTDTIGDFVCTVKSAELRKDWEGKDAVLITYEFTNNSSDAISFDMALVDDVYQDGIGLERAILDDDTDILDVDIKPGVTKEVKKAYVLRDTSTPLEIEITEFISFSDDKITTTVEIK